MTPETAAIAKSSEIAPWLPANGPFYLEDFEPGREFVHHWGRTITEADTVLFATQTHQYEPALVNREYATELGHDRCLASPLLAFAVVLGLSVEDLSESGGPFLGADALTFHEPVYAGDTLHAVSVVDTRRPSSSRPGWGVVAWHTVGINQCGRPVLDYRRSSIVRGRHALDAGNPRNQRTNPVDRDSAVGLA